MSLESNNKSIKSVVILSGGLDSSMNLFLAHERTDLKLALTFNYGQRAAAKEIETAKKLTSELGVAHQVVDLTWMKVFGKSSLLDTSLEIPTNKVEIDNFNQSLETAKSVWVPNRNGIFLNIGAGFAEALGADILIPGFNKEEATTFPDNSEAYMKALDTSFSFSTQNKVKTHCYTVAMDKTEIVALGKKMNFPFKEIWPCYFSYEKWCGQCESCKRYRRALDKNQVQLDTYFRE